MSPLLFSLLLGGTHAVSDGAAGFLVGRLATLLPLVQVGQLVLLYNVLAFATQPLIGVQTDRWQQPRAATVSGLFLMGAALLSTDTHPTLAIIIAGLGSAAFHVGGGALVFYATRGRASGPGLFAAPGVVGLALGGALGLTGGVEHWPWLIALVGLALVIWVIQIPSLPTCAPRHEPLCERHAGVVVVLLLIAIALRSAVWNSFQFVHQREFEGLMALTLAAALGKLAGGVLADHIGWRRWSIGALGLAALLLTIGGQQTLALLLGIALLQSTTPVMWMVLAHRLPARPATASGFALGLAIALGGVPAFSGWTAMLQAPLGIVWCLAIAVLLCRWTMRQRVDVQAHGPLRLRQCTTG
jgi:FSR family fosmidomycin resistance protein-like MFS transporter